MSACASWERGAEGPQAGSRVVFQEGASVVLGFVLVSALRRGLREYVGQTGIEGGCALEFGEWNRKVPNVWVC